MESAVDAVTQHHVQEMIDVLVDEFEGRFERARIEELMADSVSQLSGQANVEDFLPVLAYRFTRERLTSIGRSPGTSWDVVFVSLSGGGRGQIAAALTSLLSEGRVTPHAAGTSRHGVLDPIVEAAIRELGIDTSEVFVRPVSPDVLAAADVIVTMGHSVGVVELPDGVKHQDWRVGDPVGTSLEEARRVRDDIERRVRDLLIDLQVLMPEEGPGEEPPTAPESPSET